MVNVRTVESEKEGGETPAISKKFHPLDEADEREDRAEARHRLETRTTVYFNVGTATVQGGLMTQIPSAGAFFTG